MLNYPSISVIAISLNTKFILPSACLLNFVKGSHRNLYSEINIYE